MGNHVNAMGKFEMNVEWAFIITGCVVLAVISTATIAYILLHHYPNNPKVAQLLMFISLFLSALLLLWIQLDELSLNMNDSLGSLLTIGAILWLLTLLGYIALIGYQILD